MSVIATAVRHLMAAGVTGEALVQAIADMEASQPKDAVAEKRRAYDRERKRAAKLDRSTGIPPESAESTESAESPPLSRPPNENKSNPPTHTPPDITTRARGGDFPCPDWAEAGLWRDLKANRKAKRLPNTPTAHAKFLRDILALVDDDWPPGRLLEAIVGRGWAAAYDPREKPNVRNLQPTRSPLIDIARTVAADMERQAAARAGH